MNDENEIENEHENEHLITRWREERKKRYPTQTNIQKKEEAEKTVEEAGGLLYDYQYQYESTLFGV